MAGEQDLGFNLDSQVEVVHLSNINLQALESYYANTTPSPTATALPSMAVSVDQYLGDAYPRYVEDHYAQLQDLPASPSSSTESEEKPNAMAEWLRANDAPWCTESPPTGSAVQRLSSYATVIEAVDRLGLETCSCEGQGEYRKEVVLPPAPPSSPVDNEIMWLPRMAPAA